MHKNNIYTSSYCIKRLRDSGFIVWKVFNAYDESDSRYWTLLLNPGQESVYITCHINHKTLGDVVFELYDSGRYFKRNIFISTKSIEVIINTLIKMGINNDAKTNPFYKKI